MGKNILVFGATGSIGSYVFENFRSEGNEVYGTTSKRENHSFLYVDNDNLDELLNLPKLDIIVWCQGYNFNDNIYNFDEEQYFKIMNVNVFLIVKSLNYLLGNNKINDNGRLVVVSSIWEEFTRDNKLSYTISKSALSGFVKSASYDLSKKNILINNVLPGVIDNEMSRKTLTENQINFLKSYFHFDRLVNLDDVYRTIKFLTIDNTGITGESIKVDLGFTNVRKYS